MSRKSKPQGQTTLAVKQNTGPRTEAGKKHSSRNSFKHGLCAQEIMTFANEDDRQLVTHLSEQIYKAYQPQGFVEEALVDRMVCAYFRLSRVIRYELRASQAEAKNRLLEQNSLEFHSYRKEQLDELKKDPAGALRLARAKLALYRGLKTVLNGTPLDDFGKEVRAKLQMELRKRSKSRADASMREELRRAELDEDISREERWIQFCSTFIAGEGLVPDVPSQEIVDRVLRYESTIERQFYRAMDQLERLQRQRLGDHILPPVRINMD
jgi:hypothetical protein